MKYFIDTEFLEGKQSKRFLGIKYGETKPTIDLISIGLKEENGREYYAISKDFNLKEAWNRYDLKMVSGDMRNVFPQGRKVYWIRENVLKPIFVELFIRSNGMNEEICMEPANKKIIENKMTYSWLKNLIKEFGKSNTQIADEIKNFINAENIQDGGLLVLGKFFPNKPASPQFYAYFADYDWVAFCWLFGNMIDLPKEFPMYCRDLKQMIDEKYMSQENKYPDKTRLQAWEQDIKKLPNYPKQTNEHNALADAKWNFELYKFLQTL